MNSFRPGSWRARNPGILQSSRSVNAEIHQKLHRYYLYLYSLIIRQCVDMGAVSIHPSLFAQKFAHNTPQSY